MASIPIDLRKLRHFLDRGWKIENIAMDFLDPSVRTTVRVRGRESDLVLESEDRAVFEFCSRLQRALDASGAHAFRRVVDLNRYQSELQELASNAEEQRQAAIRHSLSGALPLQYAPQPLIREFLTSRQWGAAQYLPLKRDYFAIQAIVLLASTSGLQSHLRLRQAYPLSHRYADIADRLLHDAFGIGPNPVQSYLRFVGRGNLNIDALAEQFLTEHEQTNDLFGMLAARGGIRGDKGLPYLIEVYRRYVEWARPLIAILSSAVCLAEGRDEQDPGLGFTKQWALITHSRYADLVDCLDPRMRHAASHSGVRYDHGRGVVQFTVLAEGQVTQFELTYKEASDRVRNLMQGLIPGLLGAFGLRQEALLALIVLSREYLELVLLIDNMAE